MMELSHTESLTEVCNFLKERGVSQTVVNSFRQNGMDKEAITKCSKEELEMLGLVEMGHIVCLKAFSMKKESLVNDKMELAQLIKSAGKDRVSTSKKKKQLRNMKTISFGWMNFKDKEKRYVSVRQVNGGGTRTISVPNSATIEELIETGKEFFCRNSTENDNMTFAIGNYKGDIINDPNFTISHYTLKHKLTKTRVYLMTKKKTKYDRLRDLMKSSNIEIDSESSGDENLNIPVFPKQTKNPDRNILHSTPSTSNAVPFEIDDSNSYNFGHIHSTPLTQHDEPMKAQNSGLIGSNDERAILRHEIDKAYEESLKADQTNQEIHASSNSEEDNNRLVTLMHERGRRIREEPSLDEDHLIITIRHPKLGSKVRLFHANSKMNEVYDWAGSLNEKPEFFQLEDFTSNLIPPEFDAFSAVFKMIETTSPISMSSSAEVAFKGFGVNDSSADFEKTRNYLQEARMKAEAELESDDDEIYEVDRNNIVENMFKLYKDTSLSLKKISIKFRNEDAFGKGVAKDVFTTFFKELFANKFSGINSNVPSTLDASEAAMFAVILEQAYVQFEIFPFQLSKAVFEYLMFNSVRDKTLVASFLDFLQTSEAEMISRLILSKNKKLSSQEKDAIYDILMDCGINTVTDINDVTAVILKAANMVFVQRPFFVLKNIQDSIKIGRWGLRTSFDLDTFWAKCKPTVENVQEYFYVEANSEVEERIKTYLTRFIKGSSEETLCMLVQFCTGSSNIEGEKISVRFVNRDETLYVNAQACFKILYLPRQFNSFKQFKTLLDYTLSSLESWAMHD